MANVLIVDDDQDMCTALRAFLEAEHHHPIIASNAQDALAKVRQDHPDLIFMDVRMPGINGLEALKQIRETDPTAYVVIMTAYGTSQTSIEAIRSGALDYIHKPFDLDDIRRLIDKALLARSLSRQADAEDASAGDRSSMVDLVGNSLRMQGIYKLIGLLASNDVPALLLGEHGVGKELAARSIHFNSSRKDRPFMTINSEGLAAEAVEMEAFGRSAVGSTPAYPGRLERANGGTLFIDEIQHWSLTAQNKLLRYLKEKCFERTGGSEAVSADVRIIAASSGDPGDKIPQTFSGELYDALHLITMEIPPLRERKEDIPALVTHFIRRHNEQLHKNIRNIDARAIAILQDHAWPGNVAELEIVTKRACIFSRGDVITVGDVEDAFQSGASPASERLQNALEASAREALNLRVIAERPADSSVFYEIVGRVETVLVREALRITDGNQVRAAEILGLNRATLRKKMNPEAEN